MRKQSPWTLSTTDSVAKMGGRRQDTHRRADRGRGQMTEKRVLRNFIDGGYVEPIDGTYADLIAPTTGEIFAAAPVSGAADVERAMAAASTAFETWRDATPSERQRALLKLADAVEARAADLVAAESQNTGKPIGLTTTEEIPP